MQEALFGMKLQIDAHLRGTVHSLTATHAGAAGIKQLPELLHGEEKECLAIRTTGANSIASVSSDQALLGVNRRTRRRSSPGMRSGSIPTSRAVRARGEHPFRIVEPLCGLTKVHYRGAAKNLPRVQVALTLANLSVLRHRSGRPIAPTFAPTDARYLR